MKKIILLYGLLLVVTCLQAQESYWQQEVNFSIKVALNDKENTLDAFETITYTNHSPDTLRFIWFHLWPNAYKNDRTAFSEQLLLLRKKNFYFSKPEQRGYINQLNFKADGSTAEMLTDSNNIDMMKVRLPQPLVPNGTTVITTPFKVKLPYNFSRSGYVGHNYQLTQWFPKPAVYDRKGWHPMPYLDQGEFYSEFGSFDVAITVPAAYVVAATGVLQDTATLQQLKEKGRQVAEGQQKTWHYHQENIHDFAWFASKNFRAKYDTVLLPSGKVIDVFAYYKAGAKAWAESVKYIKKSLRKYSAWLGDYPYTVATVVQAGGSAANGSGMEYPTICAIDGLATGHDLEITIVHELGHNWFYGALASNERQHPWMDEGMNTWYDQRYDKEQSGAGNKADFMQNKLPADLNGVLLATLVKLRKDQPIETPSIQFTDLNYALVAYYKTSQWMKKIQGDMGAALFDSCMRTYYLDYRFRHVYPEDFKASLEKTCGRNLDSSFALLRTTGSLVEPSKKVVKPSFLFSLKDTDKYNYINLAPAIGFNNYDKLMVGALIHDYQLPPSNLRFVAAALYGTGSKQWDYIVNAFYTFYPGGKVYSIVPAIGFSRFNIDNGSGADYEKVFRGFSKIAPSLRIEFANPNPLSTVTKWAELKAYFIKEGTLDFQQRQAPQDTLDYYAIKGKAVSTSIYQASISIQDDRVLYPYKAVAMLQQVGDIVRATITANYYYNYSEHQGVSLRFFGGKIFYTQAKTQKLSNDNDRYQFSMYGPNGYDDYTYSNPFFERNQSTGFLGRQVMIRDGGFKYRSDFSNERPGRSDNWLAAINLSSDIPTAVNPLSVLPVRIPLKIFADVGTYAAAWKENSVATRFLYSIGLQLPVLKYVNVYCVILQSSQFKNPNDNNGDKWWQKRVTFSIDVQNISRKIHGLDLW